MGNSLVQISSCYSSSSTARAESVMIGIVTNSPCLSSLNLVVESLISRYGEIKCIKTEATTHCDFCSVVSLSVARNQRELLVVIILLNEMNCRCYTDRPSLPVLLLLFKSPKEMIVQELFSSSSFQNWQRLCGDSDKKWGADNGGGGVLHSEVCTHAAEVEIVASFVIIVMQVSGNSLQNALKKE